MEVVQNGEKHAYLLKLSVYKSLWATSKNNICKEIISNVHVTSIIGKICRIGMILMMIPNNTISCWISSVIRIHIVGTSRCCILLLIIFADSSFPLENLIDVWTFNLLYLFDITIIFLEVARCFFEIIKIGIQSNTFFTSSFGKGKRLLRLLLNFPFFCNNFIWL